MANTAILLPADGSLPVILTDYPAKGTTSEQLKYCQRAVGGDIEGIRAADLSVDLDNVKEGLRAWNALFEMPQQLAIFVNEEGRYVCSPHPFLVIRKTHSLFGAAFIRTDKKYITKKLRELLPSKTLSAALGETPEMNYVEDLSEHIMAEAELLAELEAESKPKPKKEKKKPSPPATGGGGSAAAPPVASVAAVAAEKPATPVCHYNVCEVYEPEPYVNYNVVEVCDE